MKGTTDPWLIQRVDAMGHTVFLTKIRWVMEMPWSFWGDAAGAKRFDSWRAARQDMRLLNDGAETVRLSDVEVTQ